MRVRSTLLVLAMVPSALFALAAQAPGDCRVVDDAGTQDAADDVAVCENTVWLSCDQAAEGKVYTPLDSVPLSPSAPTQSVADGAGCGKAEISQAEGTATTSIYDLNTAGFIEGNVDSITVELHSIYAARTRVSGKVPLSVRLVVGGVSPTGSEVISGTTGDIESPKRFTVDVDPTPSATGASESLVFTLTDVYKAFPELSELGDGTGNYQTLDVTVSVEKLDWAGTFVMGTTEVPANITINGEPRGTIVSTPFLKQIHGG